MSEETSREAPAGGPVTRTVAVLYENGGLIAVDKPEGVISLSEAGKGGLPELLREQGAYGGRLFPVHRLDRGASGVIVYAKDPDTHRHLNGEFDRRAVRKTYLALVHGIIGVKSVTVDKPIRLFGSGRMGVDLKRGKPSVTEIEVDRRFRRHTLVRAHPLTGRRHQIRVHLYSLGHPIAGDLRYGNRAEQEGFPRLMLHALEIEFALPSGERVKIAAPVPESFSAVLKSIS